MPPTRYAIAFLISHRNPWMSGNAKARSHIWHQLQQAGGRASYWEWCKISAIALLE